MENPIIIVFILENDFYKINRQDYVRIICNQKIVLDRMIKKLKPESRRTAKRYFKKIRQDNDKTIRITTLADYIEQFFEVFEKLLSPYKINPDDFAGEVNFDEYFSTGDINSFSEDVKSRIIRRCSQIESERFENARRGA